MEQDKPEARQRKSRSTDLQSSYHPNQWQMDEESGPVRGRNNLSPRLQPWERVAVQEALERATQTPHMLFRPFQGSVAGVLPPTAEAVGFCIV